MKRLFAGVLLAGCATTTTPTAPSLDACDLDNETACVAYGASAAPAVETPSGQLVVGLATRAASLPPTEAVDYWRRVVDIVNASDKVDTAVNHRAAPSYASLAALAVDDVSSDAEVIEEALAESHAAVEKVRELAEFAVRWGSPETQARGARALVDAYSRQADALSEFALPPGLTQDGRTILAGKRDGLVRELRAQVELLHAGLAEHCQAHQLELAECQSAAVSTMPDNAPVAEGSTCGVRIGMPASTVADLLGEPIDTKSPDAAGCVIQHYDALDVTLCFDTVRDVRRTKPTCP